MSEMVTRTTSDAIKSRLTRARDRLTQTGVRTGVWEASLLAHVTCSLAHAFRIPAVARPMYGSQSLAIVDTVENLNRITRTELFGLVVPSAPDVMQAAREIENACRVVASGQKG